MTNSLVLSLLLLLLQHRRQGGTQATTREATGGERALITTSLPVHTFIAHEHSVCL